LKKLVGVRKRFALLAAASAVLGVPSAAQADITQVFTDTSSPVDCTVQAAPNAGVRFCTNQAGEARSTVPTFDGVPVDVNVALPPAPASGPDGPYPTVMMFHGYGGSKIGLASMKRWLDQGYATFSMTTRGFNQTCGTEAARTAGGAACDDGYLRLMDTRYEVRDAQELIALLVDEDLVDPGAIGATGGSYGGGLSMALAALKNRKMLPDGSLVPWVSPDGTDLELAAAAPEIPWTDLAYSLVPNGGTLDYISNAPYFGHIDQVGIDKKAWVNQLYSGPLFIGIAYYAEPLTDPDADLATWKFLLEAGGPYGQDARDIVDEITAHHSSYYIDDSVEPAPLLISGGFTDDLFPTDEAARFYNRTLTKYPDADMALTFGDFGHPRGQNQSATTNYVGARENAWMAHYLKGQGTEPVQGVDALTQVCGGPPAGPFHGSDLSTLAPGEITLSSADAKQIVANGQVLFGSEFQGDFPTPPNPNACKTVGAGDSAGGAVYKLPAAPAAGYTLLGSPTVIAKFDSPGENNQVAARLMDIAPNGDQKLIARGLWRPETGSEDRQVFQLHANGWKFEDGHIAKLELLPQDSPYGVTTTGQTDIGVSNLELRLPVLESPGALGGLVAAPAEKVLPGTTQLAPGFDSGPPVTRFVLTPAELSSDASPTFDYMSSDVGSTYECRIDSVLEQDFTVCPRNKTLPALGDGEHVFEVRAVDQDDNADPTPLTFEFTVDTTAPNTTAKLKGSGKPVKVEFSANEDGATFECKRRGDWHKCKSPKTIKYPGGKDAVLRVRAIDRAGNVDESPAKVKLKG
jgi:dienelactone hydrolase